MAIEWVVEHASGVCAALSLAATLTFGFAHRAVGQSVDPVLTAFQAAVQRTEAQVESRHREVVERRVEAARQGGALSPQRAAALRYLYVRGWLDFGDVLESAETFTAQAPAGAATSIAEWLTSSEAQKTTYRSRCLAIMILVKSQPHAAADEALFRALTDKRASESDLIAVTYLAPSDATKTAERLLQHSITTNLVWSGTKASIWLAAVVGDYHTLRALYDFEKRLLLPRNDPRLLSEVRYQSSRLLSRLVIEDAAVRNQRQVEDRAFFHVCHHPGLGFHLPIKNIVDPAQIYYAEGMRFSHDFLLSALREPEPKFNEAVSLWTPTTLRREYAALFAGFQGEDAAIPILATMATKDAQLREIATVALSELGTSSEAAVRALEDLLQVRRETGAAILDILAMLGNCGDAKTLDVLTKFAGDATFPEFERKHAALAIEAVKERLSGSAGSPK